MRQNLRLTEKCQIIKYRIENSYIDSLLPVLWLIIIGCILTIKFSLNILPWSNFNQPFASSEFNVPTDSGIWIEINDKHIQFANQEPYPIDYSSPNQLDDHISQTLRSIHAQYIYQTLNSIKVDKNALKIILKVESNTQFYIVRKVIQLAAQRGYTRFEFATLN